MVDDSQRARERRHTPQFYHHEAVHVHVFSTPLQMFLLRRTLPCVGEVTRPHKHPRSSRRKRNAERLRAPQEREKDDQSRYIRVQMQTVR